MRPSLPLCLLILIATTACGAEDRALTVTPAEHDFGRVMQGQMPEFAFTLTNNSDRTIGFKAVPNCACFAAAHGLRPLDPGKTQTFHVLFDTTQLMGVVQGKWITLHTDHPDVPGIVVPLKGEIYRAFDVSPPTFHLGTIDGRPANYEPRVIRVRPESGYAVRLEKAVANPGVLTLEPRPHASGGVDVHMSIPRDMRRPIGPFRARVRLDLALTAPNGKTLRQSAHVDLDANWRLAP